LFLQPFTKIIFLIYPFFFLTNNKTAKNAKTINIALDLTFPLQPLFSVFFSCELLDFWETLLLICEEELVFSCLELVFLRVFELSCELKEELSKCDLLLLLEELSGKEES